MDEEKLKQVQAHLALHFHVEVDLINPLIDFIGSKAPEIAAAYHQKKDGIDLKIATHPLATALATPIRYLPLRAAEDAAQQAHRLIRQVRIRVDDGIVYIGFVEASSSCCDSDDD